MLLSQLWVSTRIFLLCQCKHWDSCSYTVTWHCSMHPECLYESQVQGHPLVWISPEKSCSEQLSLIVAGRALGTISLLSSDPSPSVSRYRMLHCVQEKTGDTAPQIGKYKAFPAVSWTLRIFPDGLWKETPTACLWWAVCYLTWAKNPSCTVPI